MQQGTQHPATRPADALARARACIENARFDEAAALLEALLPTTTEPAAQRDAWYMLAVADRYRHREEAALTSLDQLLEIEPGHARAHQERGHALLALGRLDEALSAYDRAVAGNPGLHASWQALAALNRQAGHEARAQRAQRQLEYLGRLPRELVNVIALMHDRELEKAERVCRAFLQRNPHHIEGVRLLAGIAMRSGIYDDAEFLLESCVELAPDHVRARTDYMNVLIRKTRFARAREQAEVLLGQQPDHPGLEASMGTILVGLGDIEAGIEHYRHVLERQSDNAEVHLLLGHALKAAGALEEAIAAYRRAYEIRPDFGDAFWSLANTKTYRFPGDEVVHIRRWEQAPGVGEEDRIHLCFAAGKALEDSGDFDGAFEYYRRGNALKKRQVRYEAEQTERRVAAQLAACTPELFARLEGAGCPDRDPIFIVGLPRAGSTLLEQILASHSMVDGTMELHNILALAQRLRGRMASPASRYPGILHELEADYFRRFGEQYLQDTRVYRAGAPFFIDKMPNNFLHVGLIRLILPNARVIDARREPMACCFSNFKQLFGEGQEFSYGLEEVGRYYSAYVRLMDHWDRVLPGFVLRVIHEDVVDDLEGQVRRILHFCGLPFEPACLEFHNTERSVRTPSSEQVRQPIYRSGLDQWRRFEAHLQPLVDALGPDVLARHPRR